MRIILLCLLAIGAVVSAETREKRQATYTFPGPRNEAANRQAAAAVYQAQQQQQQQQQQPRRSRTYVQEEPETTAHLYPASRRQYPQDQPAQYVPVQLRGPPAHAAPQEVPVYDPPPRAPAPRQTYSAPAPPPQRKKASASSRGNKYGSAPQQSLNGADEEDEEDAGPDPLTLLLEDSKFSCGGKNDGYYADDSVNCQVFHYCVSGARHSWMCPEGTVFHQVHLNCVPDSQDICAQSQKFHFVNDYLYKPVDYQGPNNTARYAQRYYPDGYVVGDPLVAPHDSPAPTRPRAQPAPAPAPAPPSYSRALVQSYPAPGPVSRPVQRPAAPVPPSQPQPQQPSPQSYHPSSQSQDYAHARALAAARGQRPARLAYQAEVPPGYRPASRHESPPSAQSQEELYQPQPETRRSVAPARGIAGYIPPRQLQQQPPPPPPPQYRPSARSSAGGRPQYPTYASNQAAGVQYDEDDY